MFGGLENRKVRLWTKYGIGTEYFLKVLTLWSGLKVRTPSPEILTTLHGSFLHPHRPVDFRRCALKSFLLTTWDPIPKFLFGVTGRTEFLVNPFLQRLRSLIHGVTPLDVSPFFSFYENDGESSSYYPVFLFPLGFNRRGSRFWMFDGHKDIKNIKFQSPFHNHVHVTDTPWF